jgi:hypothetical protein
MLRDYKYQSWKKFIQSTKRNRFVRFVLFSNGVIDLLAAIALFFPVLKLPLPGYATYTHQLAFVAGGWGIAALTFGIGRIWASYKIEFHWMMVILGLLEGFIFSMYCLINILFLNISLLQAFFPLAVGSIYTILYFVAMLSLFREDEFS